MSPNEKTLMNATELEYRIEGPQSVDEILHEVVQRSAFMLGFNAGHAQGLDEGESAAFEKAIATIQKRVTDYLNEVTELSNELNKCVVDSPVGIKIESFRSRLDILTWNFFLFVVLDECTFEKELEFGKMVAEFEKKKLVDEQISVEIMYGAKSESFDMASLKRDYPFAIRV